MQKGKRREINTGDNLGNNVNVKIAVIIGADTIANPRAVVVEAFDAIVANSAM